MDVSINLHFLHDNLMVSIENVQNFIFKFECAAVESMQFLNLG